MCYLWRSLWIIVKLYRALAIKPLNCWNTLAECKFVIQEDGHNDWISCGWDRTVKVWNLLIVN